MHDSGLHNCTISSYYVQAVRTESRYTRQFGYNSLLFTPFKTTQMERVQLRRFPQSIPGKLSRLRLPVAAFATLYRLKMTPLPGYWDADHDRQRTMNTKPSNAQCTNICISKSPSFSLRTSILLLASVILAPSRKYTKRRFTQKTTVAPLCEWITRRAKRLN